ncbi:hypothetical protein D3C81_2106090 [compost metagenome]
MDYFKRGIAFGVDDFDQATEDVVEAFVVVTEFPEGVVMDVAVSVGEIGTIGAYG